MVIDSTFWVAVSFFIFFGGLVYLKVPQKINEILNKLITDIKNEIDESEKLRKEAKDLLNNAQSKLDTAQSVRNEILEQAKKDRDRYNTLNNAKQNIIDEINKAYKRVETNMIDKIGPGEVDSYLSVLRLQEKIFFEAKGIIDGDIEMSESAKQKKLEMKLKLLKKD